MKQVLLLYIALFYIMAVQSQPSPFFKNSAIGSFADPLPMPYLLYPYQDKEVAFVREDFTFMWKIDSIKYPPEKYNFKYDFLIVRVEKGQKPEEAVEKNKPLFQQQDIPVYYVNYPWNAEELSDGSTYAWRVSSKDGSGALLHSKISSFIINNKLEKVVPLRRYYNYYTELREKLDASFQIAYDCKLLFKYEELYEVNNQNLRFKVYDDASNIIVQTNESGAIITGSVPAAPIQAGLNYLSLNFQGAFFVDWGTFYTLEVWNAKNERWFLKFTTAHSYPLFQMRPYRPNVINEKELDILKD